MDVCGSIDDVPKDDPVSNSFKESSRTLEEDQNKLEDSDADLSSHHRDILKEKKFLLELKSKLDLKFYEELCNAPLELDDLESEGDDSERNDDLESEGDDSESNNDLESGGEDSESKDEVQESNLHTDRSCTAGDKSGDFSSDQNKLEDSDTDLKSRNRCAFLKKIEALLEKAILRNKQYIDEPKSILNSKDQNKLEDSDADLSSHHHCDILKEQEFLIEKEYLRFQQNKDELKAILDSKNFPMEVNEVLSLENLSLQENIFDEVREGMDAQKKWIDYIQSGSIQKIAHLNFQVQQLKEEKMKLEVENSLLKESFVYRWARSLLGLINFPFISLLPTRS